MALLDNYDVRVAFISWLKANATILATLDDVNEIREQDWQGEKFSYQNYRVTTSLTPTQCNYANVEGVLSAYSEEKSSKESIQMQGVAYKEMHECDFQSEGVQFSNIIVTSLPDAIREENGVWKADVNFSATVSEVV